MTQRRVQNDTVGMSSCDLIAGSTETIWILRSSRRMTCLQHYNFIIRDALIIHDYMKHHYPESTLFHAAPD